MPAPEFGFTPFTAKAGKLDTAEFIHFVNRQFTNLTQRLRGAVSVDLGTRAVDTVIDLHLYDLVFLTAGANIGLVLSTAVKPGSRATVVLKQDDVGGRVVTWQNVVWNAGTAPALLTTPGISYALEFIFTHDNVWQGFVSDAPASVTSLQLASDAVTQDKIADAAVTTAAFAQGIEPVAILNALPDPVTASSPSIVFLTTDRKLYRKDAAGTAYTAVVAAADVDGELLAEQIADGAVTTAKFAQGIEPVAVLDALPAASGSSPSVVFLTTDRKLYRKNAAGTAYVVSVPTTDLEGTLATAQLADLSVTLGKLAADSVNASKLVAGAVTETKLAAQAVTNAKIAVDAIQGAVIAAGAITEAKIAASAVTATQLAAGAVTNAKLAVDSVQGAVIAAGAITEAKIADGAIAEAKLAAQAVTNAKLAVDSVQGAVIAAGAITEAKIADGAIAEAKLAAQAVTNAKLAVNSVQGAVIAAGAITEAKIADGAIAEAKLAAAAVTNAKLAVDSVQGAVIAAGAITEAKIGAGAVTTAKIADAALTTAKFAAGIEPVAVLAALPAPVLTSSPSVVLLTTDRKLYRKNAGSTAYVATVPTTDLSGTITNAQLAVDSVQGAVIAAGAITAAKIADGAVESAKLAAAAVTNAKLAVDSVQGAVIAAGAITTAKIAAGAVTATELAAAAVTNAKLAVDAVQGAVIAAGAITATKISDGAIETAKLAAGAVIAAAIAAGAVTTAKLDALAVTADKIAASAVTADKINAGAVTTAKLAASAVEAGNIAAGAVTTAKLAAGAVTANEIAANAVTSAKILAGEIGTGHLAALAVTTAKIAAGAVTATELAAGSVTAGKIAAGTIVAADIAASTITGAKIAASTITGSNIAAATITASNLAADTITAGVIAAGAIGTSELASRSITAEKLLVGVGSNLIPNPDFETGDTSGWRLWSNSAGISVLDRSNAAVPSGAPGRKVCQYSAAGVTTAMFSHTGTYNAPGDGVPVRAGEKYLLEVAYAGAPGTSQVTLYIYTYLADGTTTQTLIESLSGASFDGTWKTHTEAYTAPANAIKAHLYVYGGTFSGTFWFTKVSLTRVSGTTLIEDGAITTAKIVANAVTATEIAADAVTSAKIQAGAITTAKLAAGAVTANEIAANAVTAAKVLAGEIGTTHLAALAVTTAKIAAGAVTATELAAGSVVAGKIAAGTIVAADIAASTITGAKIAADTISTTNLAALAVTTAKIAAGAVTATELAAGSVVAGKIAAGTIVAADIAAGTITGAKIAAETIATGNLAALAVTTAKIAAGAVTASELAAGAVTAGKIAAGTIVAADIAASTITGAKIAAGTITAANILAGTITATEIAGATITGAKIAAGTITAGNIAAGTITATEIAAATITGAKIAAGTITASNILANTITATEIAASAITSSELAANAVIAGKIAAGTIVAADIASNTLTTEKLQVGSVANRINNWSTTGTLTGWAFSSGAAAATAQVATDVLRDGVAVRTLQFDSSGDSMYRTDLIEVDPNTTYELRIATYRAAGVGGAQYFGFYAYDSALTQLSVTPFVVSTRAFGATTNNPYFWNTAVAGDGTWRDMVAYVLATGTAADDVLPGLNVTNHFRLPPNAKYIRVRVLNWANAGVSRRHDWYSPSVTPISQSQIHGNLLVSGTVAADRLVANSITAGQVAAGAIGTTQLAASAVTATKIAAGTITANEIAALTITGAKIAASTITGSNIAAGTITAANIAADTITAGVIQAGAIGTSELAALAVTTAKIAASAVTANEIAANAITAGKILAGEIGTGHLAADSITTAKLALDAIQDTGATRGVLFKGSRPVGWTRYLDLTATGTTPFLKHEALELLGNGTATFSGALSAATGTFAGSLSAATGTFAGALSAATGTFAGSLSAASGTFSGDITGASGTFSGTIASSSFTTGEALFSGMAQFIDRIRITHGTPTVGYEPGLEIYGPTALGGTERKARLFATGTGSTVRITLGTGAGTLDIAGSLTINGTAVDSSTSNIDWSRIINEPDYTTRWPAFSEVTGSIAASQLPIVTTAKGGTGVDNSTGGSANTFFARPDGVSGAATFRGITAADIPGLDTSKLSTGQLSTARGGLGVDASTGGTAGHVFARPAAASGAASFRALVASDIPSLAASKITSGQVGVANGGTGLATLTGANRLLYSTGTTTLTTLAPYATANNGFLRQNASGAPAWARISYADIDYDSSGFRIGSASGLTRLQWTGTAFSFLNTADGYASVEAQTFSSAGTGAGFKAIDRTGGTSHSWFYRSGGITRLWISDTSTDILTISAVGAAAFAGNLSVSGGTLVVGTAAAGLATEPSYLKAYDPTGHATLHLGGADPANYYSNSAHHFRSRAGVTSVSIYSTGIALASGARINNSYNHYYAPVIFSTADPTSGDLAEDGSVWFKYVP